MKELLDISESLVEPSTSKWVTKRETKTHTLFHKDGLWVKHISYNEKKQRDGITIVYKNNGETLLVWYSKGVKKNAELYNSNEDIKKEIPYRNGLKCGFEKCYDNEGRLMLEIPYENGKRQGVGIQYDQDGSIVSKTRYDNDKEDENYEEVYCPYEDDSIV